MLVRDLNVVPLGIFGAGVRGVDLARAAAAAGRVDAVLAGDSGPGGDTWFSSMKAALARAATCAKTSGSRLENERLAP